MSRLRLVDEGPRQRLDPYAMPVPHWVMRIAGGILLALGVLAALLLGLVVWKSVPAGVPPTTALIACSVLLPIAAIANVAGMRLVLNRPTPNGSMLSRSGWLLTGAGFILLALGLPVLDLVAGRPLALHWSSFPLGLGAACVGMAARRAIRRRENEPTSS